MVCADARIVLIAAVRASWDMVRIAFTRAKVMQKRIRYTFYFALRFALRYAGRCLCNFILFFAASIRFFVRIFVSSYKTYQKHTAMKKS